MFWESPEQELAGRKLLDPEKKMAGLGRTTRAAHHQRDASGASEEWRMSPAVLSGTF